MTGEQMKFICRDCSKEVVPYEYNTLSGDIWFEYGYLKCEMQVRCPHCRHLNVVHLAINQVEVLEVTE